MLGGVDGGQCDLTCVLACSIASTIIRGIAAGTPYLPRDSQRGGQLQLMYILCILTLLLAAGSSAGDTLGEVFKFGTDPRQAEVCIDVQTLTYGSWGPNKNRQATAWHF